MPIVSFRDISPSFDPSAFIAPDAWLIGDVRIHAHVSIFFGAVLRGDIHSIQVGEGTNIQEHSVLHTSYEFGPVVVGKNVTVGHRVILHGCTVEDECLIGMGATILDNARVGYGSIIGAHALLPKGVVIPPHSLVLGTPGRVIRNVSPDEQASLLTSADRYRELGSHYKKCLTGSVS